MLYSKENIMFEDVDKEVWTYLKKTRYHSYRISPRKISLTLPNVYKKPETIEQHKADLLVKVREHLTQKPELLHTTSLLQSNNIHILGESYKLIRLADPAARLQFNYGNKTIYLPSELNTYSKAKLVKSILSQYAVAIEQRVRYINRITIHQPIRSVELKNNQSTWGLCSSKGEITLSLQTLFAPLWVVDYVIVHELCHLVHHDHSPDFWQLVERFYPKYKLAKSFLKTKGLQLVL